MPFDWGSAREHGDGQARGAASGVRRVHTARRPRTSGEAGARRGRDDPGDPAQAHCDGRDAGEGLGVPPYRRRHLLLAVGGSAARQAPQALLDLQPRQPLRRWAVVHTPPSVGLALTGLLGLLLRDMALTRDEVDGPMAGLLTTGPPLRRAAIPWRKSARLQCRPSGKPPAPSMRRWRNARHSAGWVQTLERHAMPALGNTPLDRIGRSDALDVLTPIWTTRPETARRVRQRMRTVFRWAMAHGYMETNPAGEAIDGALPPMPRVKAHLRALPYQDVQAALETVESSQASVSAKLCFRFLVLTAARSGEARGPPGMRSMCRARNGGYRLSG